MNPQIVAAIRARARLYRDELAQLLAELVRIPSPSGREEAVVRRIGLAMAEAGFAQIRTDGLGSLIGRIGRGPRLLAMDAHIDTVAVGNRELWTRDPFGGEIDEGRVWGRGAADQKGGMAALIYAGRIMSELGLGDAFTLHITGTVMEEDCDGLCWRHLIREDRLIPEVCVLTEPTGCRLYRGQRGRMEMQIDVQGVSAHASAPERGTNAIVQAAQIVREIERLGPRLATDEFLGQGSIAVTHIHGEGPSLCAIPDQARIHIDRRLTWGETREQALDEVAAIIAGCAPDGASGASGAARLTIPRFERPAYTGKIYPAEAFFPAWKLAADHPAVRAGEATLAWLERDGRVAPGDARAAGARGGAGSGAGKGAPARWTFSTNGVAICGEQGIPCVGFGPAHEAQAHAPDEFCPIDHLVDAAAFYALFPLVYTETMAGANAGD
jgi:putative selenium metabolism hydrolase